MSKIFLSLLSLVMITVMAGCSKPAPSAGGEGGAGDTPAQRHPDEVDPAAPAEAPAAPAEAPAAPAAPAEGAAPAAAPAPSASAAPLSGTTWA